MMPYHWLYMPYRAGGYPLGYAAYDVPTASAQWRRKLSRVPRRQVPASRPAVS